MDWIAKHYHFMLFHLLVTFGVLYLFLNPDAYLLLFCCAGIAGVLLLRSHTYALYILILSVFVIEWLSTQLEILPRQLTWISDVTIILLIAKTIFTFAQSKSISSVKNPLLPIHLILIVTGTLGLIWNAVHPITVLLSLKIYAKYILLFYSILVLRFPERVLKKIIRFTLIILLFQVPVSIIQKIIHRGHSGDFVVGTLGQHAANELSIFSMFGISIFLAFYLVYKRHIYLLASILLFIPPILSAGKVFFFFLPLLLAFMFRKSFIQQPGRVVVLLVMYALIYYGAIQGYNYYYGESRVGKIDYLLSSPESVILYETVISKSNEMGRFGSLVFIHNLLTRDWLTFLIGVGPGNASDSYFDNYKGKYYQVSSSQIVTVRHTFSRVLLELGYIGLLSILGIWITTLYHNANFMKTLMDPFWRSVVLGVEGIVFITFIGSLYIDTIFRTDVLPFAFWLFLAVIFKVRREKAISAMTIAENT